MGVGYDPTRIIDGVDTGKIRMARRFARAMHGHPVHQAETLLELSAALEEAGRAEEAAQVLEFTFARAMRGKPRDDPSTLRKIAAALREAGRAEEAAKILQLADSRIDNALAPFNRTVVAAQQSGDLPAQCFAFIGLAQMLRDSGRGSQADSAFKSAEELSDRISAIVRQPQYEPDQLYSWIAGLHSLNLIYDLLYCTHRGEAAERLWERCNGFCRNMADAAIETGFKDAAEAQQDHDPHREGKAMAMLARALHEVDREHESAFCAAEARRLGHGNYRKISGRGWDWSSTAKPGPSDPAAYRCDDTDLRPDMPDKPMRSTGGLPPETYIGELILGYLAIKTLGPFLEAFATKLGEQLGEATGRAISRLRLRRRPNTRDQVEVEAGATTTVVLPEPFTDNAREVFIDIDVTDPHIRGKTLHWDEDQGKFLPQAEPGSDPGQGRGRPAPIPAAEDPCVGVARPSTRSQSGRRTIFAAWFPGFRS